MLNYVYSNDESIHEWEDEFERTKKSGRTKTILKKIHKKISSFEGEIAEYPGPALSLLQKCANGVKIDLDFTSLRAAKQPDNETTDESI